MMMKKKKVVKIVVSVIAAILAIGLERGAGF